MLLRLTSSTLALAVMAAPVFSLTAEEVWQNWETYLTGHGYEVAVGAREDGGDALTLRDVVLRMVDADSEVTSAVTIPLIRMSPTGGADIRSEFPEPLTFRVEGTSGGDDKTVVEGLIDVTASETISREADGRQSDSVTMPEGRIALSSLEIEGDRIEGEPMTLVLRNLRSSATLGGGAGVDGEVEIEGATLLVDMSDVDGKATIRGQGELGAMKLVTRSFLPEGHDNRNPAAMAAALDRAITRGEPIVVTSWRPHWMWAAYDLKYLEDPEGVFGDAEQIHTIVSQDFADNGPEDALAFLENFYWTGEDMGAVMLKILDGMEPFDAAREWISENPDMVQGWLGN